MRKFFTLLLGLLVYALPASAQDVGFFVRNGTSTISNPVANQTYLLNESTNTISVWNGSSWQQVTTSFYPQSGAPTSSNDGTEGYLVGSFWFDTVGQNLYVCANNSTGAAVWDQISITGGSGNIALKLTEADAMTDWVVTGLLASTSSSLSTTTTAGTAYVTGSRTVVTNPVTYSYSASSDTYDYLQTSGVINHIAVPNAAPAPTGQPGLLIQKVVSSGSAITGVTQEALTAPLVKVANATNTSQALNEATANGLYAPAYSGAANMVVATPNGSSGLASLRSLVTADEPSTTVNASGTLSPLFNTSISGQTINFSQQSASGGTVFGNFGSTSANPSFQAQGSNDQILGVVHSGTGLEYKTITAGAGISVTPAAGSITITSISTGGTVTSINNSGPSGVLTWSGGPITASGTLSATLNNQSANTLLAGPTSGSATTPAFRSQVDADLPQDAVVFGGPATTTYRQLPTSGTLTGEYWYDGNWTQTGIITCNRCIWHINGNMTANNQIACNTELSGGYRGYGALVATGGQTGSGLGGGQGATTINGTNANVSGAGGGCGGQGGNGGCSTSTYSIPTGGQPYFVQNMLTGSGGGGGNAPTGAGAGSSGGPGGGGFRVDVSGNISMNSGTLLTATGGTGGVGSTSGNPGGGAGSGGVMDLRCNGTFTVAASASITCTGGVGGAGGGGSTDPGGGGGGGGIIYIRSGGTYTNNGTVSCSGGSAGSSGSSVSTLPTTGANGTVDAVGSVPFGIRL